jgi:hypothetical protein
LKKVDSILHDIEEEISFLHSNLKRRKDGLIIVQCADNHAYKVEEIKENHEAIKKLSPGKMAFVLNIAGKYTSIEPETKSFMAKGPHKSFIAAEAFVIQNLAQRILAQFYFKINRPIVPSEYFTDVKKAEAWILRQMKKH